MAKKQAYKQLVIKATQNEHCCGRTQYGDVDTTDSDKVVIKYLSSYGLNDKQVDSHAEVDRVL